jgi:hypothetical protein
MLTASGHTNRSIADILTVAEQTVESHLYDSSAKHGVRRREQLAQHRHRSQLSEQASCCASSTAAELARPRSTHAPVNAGPSVDTLDSRAFFFNASLRSESSRHERPRAVSVYRASATRLQGVLQRGTSYTPPRRRFLQKLRSSRPQGQR